MKNILLIIFLSIFLTTFPCGNEYESSVNPSGDIIDVYDSNYLKAHRLKYGFDTLKLQEDKNDILSLITSNQADFRDSSNLALIEMKIGDRQYAIDLLETLYKSHPNEYNITANLGTAYELIGENKLAIKLIKEAIIINPESHYESEWIHVKILEEKLKAKPNYRSIINLNITNLKQEFETLKIDSKQDLIQKRDQLRFQLLERISFIKPPNKILGQLLIDQGDLIALTTSMEFAKDYYLLSLKYDESNNTQIDSRLKEIEKAIEFKFFKQNWMYFLFTLITLTSVIWLIKRYLRKKNKHNTLYNVMPTSEVKD